MISQAKERLVAAQVAVIAFVSSVPTRLRSERGQASAEYVGIIIVAAIIVVALIAGAAEWGKSIVDGITKAIKAITDKTP